MSYPEQGATYKHKPAWLDRSIVAEKRAEGGATKYPNKIPGLTDEQIDANEARRPAGEMGHAYLDDAARRDAPDMRGIGEEIVKPEIHGKVAK